MSRTPLVPWSLVVAALLVPAALHAQAETDSISSTSAHHARDAGPGVETGHVDTAAQGAGQAGIKTDTALKAKRDLENGKAKRHHKEADSMKTRADTAVRQPYTPY